MSVAWDAWVADQTATTFRAVQPEFTRASDALIESRIAMAQERTPSDVWGTLRAQGILLLAAHMLASLPEAKDMRKGEKVGESAYGRQREILERVVSSGYRIAGLPSTTLPTGAE